MLTRLRDQIGTAGLVVAVIALVAALGGGAYAASKGLNPTQKKEVKKIAKSFQGTGPAGAAGPAGPQGPAGPKGEAGSAGAAGKDGVSAETATFTGAKGGCTNGGVTVKSASPEVNVCNGKNGKDGETGFTEVLPSGKTETGAWSMSFGGGVSSFGSMSFAIPLPAPLAADHVVKTKLGYNGEDEVGAEHEHCPGKASNPQAAPGYLCFYIGYGSGVNEEIEAIFDPSEGPFGSGGASKAGAGFFFPESASGFASGTWAVTAP